MRKKDDCRKGFSITELALVVCVMGLILAGIWTWSGSVRQANMANQAVADLKAVVEDVASWGQTTMADFSAMGSGLSIVQRLVDAGAIPKGQVTSVSCFDAPCVMTPWGKGGMNVEGRGATGSFRVSFYEVPKEVCIRLLLEGTLCRVGASTCPVAVSIRGGVGVAPAAGVDGWKGVMTPPVALGLCDDSGAVIGPLSVGFDYKI